MLTHFSRYIKPMRNVKVSSLHLNGFINNLTYRSDTYITRTYKYSYPIINESVELLTSFLYKAGLYELTNFKTHEERLKYIRKYLLSKYESYTTTSSTNINKYNTFIHKPFGKANVPEALIITYQSSPYGWYDHYTKNEPIVRNNTDIPIDIKNDLTEENEQTIQENGSKRKFFNFDIPIYQIDNWKLRPFDMIYLNSSELSLDFKPGKLKFIDSPTSVLYRLDIERFIMGALYYADQHSLDETIRWYDYVYQWCLLPTIYDNLDQWLLNVIVKTLEYKNLMDPFNELDIKELNIDIKRFLNITSNAAPLLTGFKNRAMGDIINLISRVQNGNLTVGDFLDNYPLINHDSISSYIDHLTEDVYLPETIDQRWRLFMRDIHIVKLIIYLIVLFPTHPTHQNLLKRIKYLFPSWKRTKFLNKCRDKYLREELKEEFDILEIMYSKAIV